ncbi:reverse transcriptase domain-containing protein, partial [Tanacetum coccineum]
MPPKRRSQTNPQPTLTQEAVDQLVWEGIEAALRAEWERVRMEATIAGGPAGGLAAAPVARECSFMGFMKCGATQFHGNEGAVELCRWFEKIESMFRISKCAERSNVKFAAATLQVVPTEKKNIKGETTSSRPTVLNEAVRMAHTLMEQKLQAKDKRIAESNKRKWESNNNQGGNNNNKNNNNNQRNYWNNNHHNQNNNQRHGNARALTTTQNAGANQTGVASKCNRCGLCHFYQCLPKCNNYGKIGHKDKECKSKNVVFGTNARPTVVCYECGERSHKSNVCPKRVDRQGGNVRGQAYVIRDAEHNQGPNVVI